LRDAGITILELDGSEVRDKRSLLRQAERDLPFPPDLPPRGWDGFVDGLWAGLADRDDTAAAIVWTDAQRMLEGALADLLVATRLFATLASQVGTTERGFPRELDLRTFLVGEGPNFPAFPRGG
jgi:Barstar (barnase inhibitor)